MVRTIAVRGGRFLFCFYIVESARVESRPETPFECSRSGCRLLFLFCLGSLVRQTVRRICVCGPWQKSRALAVACEFIVYVLFAYMCGFELHVCDLNYPYKHVEETRPQLWLWNNM